MNIMHKSIFSVHNKNLFPTGEDYVAATRSTVRGFPFLVLLAAGKF